MEYSLLPGTTRRVSRIAFGCAAMGGYDYGPVDDSVSIAAVHRALDLGINCFDTADVYGFGHAERVLAGALVGRRTEVVIATKGGVRWDASGRTTRTLDPSYLVQALESSLQRLETDYIDLYQLHWPVAGAVYDHIMETLERCRTAGKLLAIGCSNMTRQEVQQLADHGLLSSEQYPFNLLDRSAEGSLKAATAAGRLTLTYNSLAQGLLAGKHRLKEQFVGTDLRMRGGHFRRPDMARQVVGLERVGEVARRVGRSSLQVALRWALDQGYVDVAITGIKQPRQADENAGAADWQLSEWDRRFLSGDESPR